MTQLCAPDHFPFQFWVEEGKVFLIPDVDLPEKKRKWCNIAQVQVTGCDHNDHHGGKHHHSGGVEFLKYVEHSFQNDLLKILLRDAQCEMVCYYRFYPEICTVRSWATVKNISNRAIGIDYIASFSMAGMEAENVWIPHNQWCREVNWRKHSIAQLGIARDAGSSTGRICLTNTGAWSTKEYLPMGILEGEGICLWQIESPGSWHWEISDKAGKLYLHLSGPTAQENGWHKELQPGEDFTSVKAAVVFAEDIDTALDYRTRYCRTIAKRTHTDHYLPVIFNDYMNCLKADPTTEKELPIIDRAASVGAELYVMDAGWYGVGSWWDTVGEWQECKERFPNGIKEVFDYVRSHGMIPGIWLEIETMGVNCPILDQFDDDCFFMRHGRRLIDHGRYQLDFRSDKVRKFATAVVDRLVDTLDVKYIKMDYNIEPGIGTEVNADSFGDGLHQHKLAYVDWVDEISEKYPDLIIENCSSGGLRMDYFMLAHHSLQSVSDQENCLLNAHIAAAAATAVIPEQAAIWSYPLASDSDDMVRLNMVNAMLNRIHLAGEITALSDNQLDIVREGVALYKRIRDNIAMSVPFYPCGIPSYDEKLFCTGYRGDKTYLAVWRLDTQDSVLNIPVQTENTRVLYGDASIDKWDNGISVTLPRQCSAAIIEL